MSANTLIGANSILSYAIWAVRQRTPPDAAPFRITAWLEFDTMALTDHIDGFADKFLIPAIDAAMRNKRPDDGVPLPEAKGVDMFARSEHNGIEGTLTRCYDLTTDLLLTRLELRVGPPSADADED